MCLFVNREKEDVRTATTVIRVYKHLDYTELGENREHARGQGIFVSPYMGETYSQGEVKKLDCFSGSHIRASCYSERIEFTDSVPTREPEDPDDDLVNYFEVVGGYHVFTKPEQIHSPNRIMVVCAIGPGTKYIVGWSNEIVTLGLIVLRAIVGDAKQVDLFNSRTFYDNRRWKNES
jgi:hypothetical protein